VRLCEHPEFDQAVLRAAEHFRDRGLRPAIIEKDYYVTEALRIVGQTAGNRIIFKGGTSLSKGWNLVHRFSEDVDLFLDPLVPPPLGTKAVDRELKRLRDAVGAHPGLTYLKDESRSFSGSRSDRFAYTQHFGGAGAIVNRVLLETGIASGREPTADVTLSSYLSEFLGATGASLGADDEKAFPLRLLHFRRTFVEKLFAIHAKVEILKHDGRPLGSYARHYYDLAQLAIHPEVIAMLRSPEYQTIKDDYDRISRHYFGRDYVAPDGMSFARSEALFPTGDLAAALGAEYERQCQLLCFGDYPSWEEVRTRFDALIGIL
jgi:hypothetical protein